MVLITYTGTCFTFYKTICYAIPKESYKLVMAEDLIKHERSENEVEK